MDPLRLVYDLETNDPDDVLALCLLATHPHVDLRAVTVFPGGHDQVGVVKHVLGRLGKPAVPVGAPALSDSRPRVSPFHYNWLGAIPAQQPDGTAVEIIDNALAKGANMLLTGAPLTNVYEALRSVTRFHFMEWTCQGGFAGDNVVAPENRLAKFLGRTTCPTFNLNGNPKAALALIATPKIGFKRFVTKNVCHGVIYDRAMHDRLPATHAGLALLKDGMGSYFRRRPEGKALHDVVAAALAICPRAASWVTGTIYREKGEWGTQPWVDNWPSSCPSEPDYISVALDQPKFEQVLAGDISISRP
jgi:inosine-uridine nucleoside N-ribohydrolase